jgi:S1-C subfamily serine protease
MPQKNPRPWLLSLFFWVFWQIISLPAQAQNQPEKPPEKTPTSLGTGFVVSAGGVVLTAHHVVKDRNQVFIKTADSELYLPAKVLAVDAQTDLALLKMMPRPNPSQGSSPLGSAPSPLMLLEPEDTQPGLDIFLLGYPNPPFQGFSLKITNGILSGFQTPGKNPLLFQFTAATQHGNSGGPVVTTDGLVIGMAVNQGTSKDPQKALQNVNIACTTRPIKEFLSLQGIPFVSRRHNPQQRLSGVEIYTRIGTSVVGIAAK